MKNQPSQAAQSTPGLSLPLRGRRCASHRSRLAFNV